MVKQYEVTVYIDGSSNPEIKKFVLYDKHPQFENVERQLFVWLVLKKTKAGLVHKKAS